MSIDAQLISPELAQLGLALGVITPRDHDGGYDLNGAFFSDPATTLGAALKKPRQRDALLRLCRSAFGLADHDSAALPDATSGVSWLPVAEHGPATAYIVVDATDTDTTLAVAASADYQAGGVGLSGSAWLPLIRIPAAGGPQLLPGVPGTRLGVRIAVRPPPPGADDAVGLDALTCEISIPTDHADHAGPVVSLTAGGLKLRGWASARDVRLTSDAGALQDQAADLAATLLDLAAAAAGLGPPGAALHLVLTLIGLGDATRVPRLQLDDVARRGGTAVREWAELILTDPSGERQQAWLLALAELAGLDPGQAGVEDSPADGLSVLLTEAGSWPEVRAHVRVTTAAGHAEVDLGVSVAVGAPSLAAVPVRGRARVGLLHAVFTGTPVLTWLPAIELEAVLGDQGRPLLATGQAGVGKLRLGLVTDADHQVRPVLRATDVTLGTSSYPSLDLTSVEAVTQAAGQAASQAVAQGLGDLLTPLLGQDAAARAAALLVLLGLQPPAGTDSSWPALPATAAFFADPLSEVGMYHARVLGDGGYARLVTAACVLFGIDDPVAGKGTDDEPWTIPVPVGEPADLGTVDVLVRGTGGQDKPVLRVDAVVTMTPVLLGDGTALTVAGVHRLARIDLPAAAGERVAITACDRHEVRLRLEARDPTGVTPEDFTGITDIDLPVPSVPGFTLPPPRLTFEAGPAEFSCAAVAGALWWERGHGWDGSVRVEEGAVQVGDVGLDLPKGFGLDWPGDGLDLTAAWPLIRLLLSARLTMPRARLPDLGLPGLSLPDLSLPDLPDLHLPALSLPELLAAFLGWMPATLPFRLRLPDGLYLDLELPGLGSGDWPSFNLPAFLLSPLPTLKQWLVYLFSGGVDLSLPAISIAGLLCGLPEVTGAGTYDDPWAVALPGPVTPVAGPAGGARLLCWLYPDGPTLAGLDEVFDDLCPAGIVPGDPGTPPPAAADLLDLLAGGARVDPRLADLLAGRESLAAALETFRGAFLDGDGLVPAAEQVNPDDRPSPAVLRGTHLDAPARFTLAGHSTADPATVMYLCAPLPGVSPWPGQDTGPLIDLRGAGRAAASFVLSPPARGPWFVQMPTRAEAGGHAGVTERLRAAVVAVTAAAGQPPVVVAHSITGWAARALHAEGTVPDLVTVAAPGAGPGAGQVADAALRDAARFLQGLAARVTSVPEPLGGALSTAAARLGDALPDATGIPRQVAFPLDDLLPPPAGPVAAAGTPPVTAVVARLAPADLDPALATLVSDVLGAVRAGLPVAGGPSRHAVTHAGFGVGFDLPVLGVPGAVDAAVSVRLDVATVRIQDGGTAPPVPRLRVRTVLRRPGDWLVATPEAAIRRAEILFDLMGQGPGGAAKPAAAMQVVLFDAGLAGIWQERLEIRADSLDATSRALLAGLAAALSPPPPAGTLADLVALLGAAGLLQAGDDGTVGFDPDATERMLADPLAHLQSVLRSHAGGDAGGWSADGRAALRSLRRLFGGDAAGTEPAVTEPITVEPVPGARLEIDPGQATVRIAVDALTVADVLRAGTEVVVALPLGRPATEVTWQARLSPATAGSGDGTFPAFELTLPPAGQPSARIVTGTAAAAIPLLPDADEAALARYLGSLAVDQALRMVLSSAAGTSAELTGLLRAVGLGDDNGEIRDALGIFLDPAGWLTGPRGLGSETAPGRVSPGKVAGVLDALAELTGVRADDDGSLPGLPLPLGGRITAQDEGGGLRLDISLTADAGAAAVPVTAGGRLGLTVRIDPQGVPSALLAGAVRVSADGAGAGLAAAELDVTGGAGGSAGPVPAGGLQVLLRLWPDATGTATVLSLLPEPGGLGPLAALIARQAVEHALPLLLDTLAGLRSADPALAPLGDAIRAAGDALGLTGQAGAFDLGALRLMAADPAAWLVARFRADPAAVATALAQVAGFAGNGQPVPGGTAAGPVVLWSGTGDRVRVELAADDAGGPVVTLAVGDLSPLGGITVLNGVTVGGSIVVDARGLGSSWLALRAVPPDPLAPGPVELLPGVWPYAELHLGGRTPADPPRAEVGLWLDPPGDAGADALALQIPSGAGAVLVRRHGGSTDDNVAAAFAELILGVAMPLVADSVLGLTAVSDAIRNTEVGAEKLIDLLTVAGVLASGEPPGSEPPRLAPGVLSEPLGAAVRAVVALAGAFLAGAVPGPVGLRLCDEDLGRSRRYLIGVLLDQPLDLPPLGDIAVAVARLQDPASDEPMVIKVGLAEVANDPGSPSPVRFAPSVHVQGLGVTVTGVQGPLMKDPLRVQGLALYGSYDHTASEFLGGGGRVEIVGIEIPVGAGSGGDNPVAAKVIAPGGGPGRGSAAAARGPAPGITPYAQIDKGATGAVAIRFGLEGGPWIPIRRAFGPVYVEQVGFDPAYPGFFTLLIDAGVHIGPLAAGLDELAVFIPLGTPADPATWQLDLAGLAISFADGGVTIAGGLRKLDLDGGVGYAGMLDIHAAGYGLNAVGVFGSFGAGGSRYTSLFVIAALSAPLGGTPAFFVLGIGAGIGLNRELVAPAEMTGIADFPLIAALNPDSQLVRDPMGALESLSAVFPPAPGAFWLAAAVRFSSFTLVESVVAVTVAVGDGLEVNVLGLARAGLPNPAAALVQVELALQARFSTREGVLSIRAQLTDNSWLFSRDCRLTGGFAFVIWFRTGEFLVTIGGFHPRFPKPGHYPDVPRLGFAWQVSSIITIKGESYFALTPTAIMTGGRLEAAANFGSVGAWFACGLDILVSWDPPYYDLSIYVTVGAWLYIDVEIWFVHISVRITVSVGAELLIQGPPMHGVARVDLGVTSVIVPFGTQPSPAKDWLGWAAFHDKYLVAGDPKGTTMDVTVTRGAFTADPGGDAGTGAAGDTVLLLPEFQLRTSTRAAANQVNEYRMAGPPLAAGPMGRASIASRHCVSVIPKDPSAGQAQAHLTITPVTGAVPDALWRMPDPNGAGGMRDAFVGADVIAEVTIGALVGPVDIGKAHAGDPRPLPLLAARDPGGTLSNAARAAGVWAASVAGQDPLVAAASLMAAAPGAALVRCLGLDAAASAAAGPGVLDTLLLCAERSAPPRLERPTARVFTPARPAPEVTIRQLPRPPAPNPPAPTPPDVPAPGLLGACRADAAASRRPRPRTTVGDWGRDFPRTHPDDVSSVLTRIRPAAARLYRAAPAVPPSGGGTTPPTPVRGGARGAHAVPGGRVEAVSGLFTDESSRLALVAATAGLAGAGTRLRAGDLQVWRVAGAADDWNPVRPVLGIDGDQAVRVVMLDLAGGPLADVTVTTGAAELPLPPGVDRVAVLGTGVPATDDRAAADPAAWPLSLSGLAGWHVGVPVLRAGEYGFVVPGGVLRTTGVTTRRARRPVDLALADPAVALRDEGLVSTTLPAMTRSVLLAVRPLDPAANTAELLIGLDGAGALPGSADRVLTAGSDVYLLRDLEPGGESCVVTVGRAPGFAVRGVLGSTRPADVVAGFVAGQGAAALVGGLVPGATGGRARTSALTWRRSP